MGMPFQYRVSVRDIVYSVVTVGLYFVFAVLPRYWNRGATIATTHRIINVIHKGKHNVSITSLFPGRIDEVITRNKRPMIWQRILFFCIDMTAFSTTFMTAHGTFSIEVRQPHGGRTMHSASLELHALCERCLSTCEAVSRFL